MNDKKKPIKMGCDDLQSEKTLISPGVFLSDDWSDRKVFILINISHTLYFIIMHSSHRRNSYNNHNKHAVRGLYTEQNMKY